MRPVLFLFLALLSTPVFSFAQSMSLDSSGKIVIPNPAITKPPASATHEQIETWLESKDPRLIAWAAFFTLKNNDSSILPALVKQANAWQMEDVAQTCGVSGPLEHQYRSMAAILHTLLEMHSTPSMEALTHLAVSYPAQVALFISRADKTEQRKVLTRIFEHEGQNTRWSSDRYWKRWSAAMLANNPSPEFSLGLVRDLELNINISIIRFHRGAGASCGGSVDCGIGMPPEALWPKMMSYGITDKENAAYKTVLRITGIHPLWIQQHAEYRWQWNGGQSFYPLDSYERLILIRQIAYGKIAGPYVKLKDSASVVYRSDKQVIRELQRIVKQHEAPILQICDTLLEKNLLNTRQIHACRPSIRLVIYDSKGVSLTSMNFPDENVVIQRTCDWMLN